MSLLNNFKHAPFAYSFLATSNRVRNGAYVLGPQHRASPIVYVSTIAADPPANPSQSDRHSNISSSHHAHHYLSANAYVVTTRTPANRTQKT